MPNPSQLFLLADHIKLSLLERQRAVSLDLEPNTRDIEISRSLNSLRDSIEATESEYARLQHDDNSNKDEIVDFKDQLDQLQLQFQDLSSQFHGDTGVINNANNNDNDDQHPAVIRTKRGSPSSSSSSPDIKQPIPQHPSTKSVRFMDASVSNDGLVGGYRDDDDDPNRKSLFQPYRDSPSPPPAPDTDPYSSWSNQQIHDHHSDVIRDQDDQLDRLGESIGRQHQLSIQIGDELDGHVTLLDGMDGDVDRHQSRLDLARRRLDKFRHNAKENWSMMTIIGLIIILVILIVILK